MAYREVFIRPDSLDRILPDLEMSKPNDESISFWKLANTGETKKDRNGTLSWDIRVQINREDQLALEEGRWFDGFKFPVSARTNRASRQEDMPFCVDMDPFIVSERLRELWETMYPGNIQYIPLPITVRGGKVIDGYYIANLLKFVDCFDKEATFAKWGDTLARQVVDPKRVPKSVGIFQMKGYTAWIIREEVRAAMKKNKITGWFVYTP